MGRRFILGLNELASVRDAFYYVRVIEIPTPRWSAYDRKFFQNEARVREGFPLTTQERAYTSPIWYAP